MQNAKSAMPAASSVGMFSHGRTKIASVAPDSRKARPFTTRLFQRSMARLGTMERHADDTASKMPQMAPAAGSASWPGFPPVATR